MTDNEIIKALECLFGRVYCRECPYSLRYEFPLCQQQVAKDAFDLINRQQAEIERLKQSLNIELENFATEYDNKIKSEAVKEFVERLKDRSDSRFDYSELVFEISEDDIDNLVKEMVGENDDR